MQHGWLHQPQYVTSHRLIGRRDWYSTFTDLEDQAQSLSWGLYVCYTHLHWFPLRFDIVSYTLSGPLFSTPNECQHIWFFSPTNFYYLFFFTSVIRAGDEWKPIWYRVWVIVSVGTPHISPTDNSCLRYIHLNLKDSSWVSKLPAGPMSVYISLYIYISLSI